jgi:hypothetical protein
MKAEKPQRTTLVDRFSKVLERQETMKPEKSIKKLTKEWIVENAKFIIDEFEKVLAEKDKEIARLKKEISENDYQFGVSEVRDKALSKLRDFVGKMEVKESSISPHFAHGYYQACIDIKAEIDSRRTA